MSDDQIRLVIEPTSSGPPLWLYRFDDGGFEIHRSADHDSPPGARSVTYLPHASIRFDDSGE